MHLTKLALRGRFPSVPKVPPTPKPHFIYTFFLQANVEKSNKMLQSEMSDTSNRLDDLSQSLNDADITKKKLAVEKTDLEKQIEDGDNTIRALGKIKTSLDTQVIAWCMI